MRVLLLTTGTRGDVQPFLALGSGLSKAGHHVLVAAPRRFAALAANEAVPFVGLDDSALGLQEELLGSGVKAAFTAVGQVRPFMRRWLNDLVQLTQLEVDVVVCTQKTLGGLSVAEKLGVPALAAQLIPTGPPTSQLAPPFAPRGLPQFLNRASWRLTAAVERPWRGLVQRWRSERLGLTGLAPSFTDLVATGGILSAWSPTLLPSPTDWPEHARPLGFWAAPLRPDWEPPRQLLSFLAAGEPPVVVGFGSMPHQDPEGLSAQVVRGLRLAGRRGVLVSGWAGIGAEVSGRDVLVIDDLPHQWLLPRASALVHHGGVGTCGAALTSGTPQVIHPFFGDQPFWGRRLRDLGVAPEPLQELTADSLASALIKARPLTEVAKRFAGQIRVEDAIPASIARIESAANRR